MSIQPPFPPATPDRDDTRFEAGLPASVATAVRTALDAHRERPGALLEVLHAVQAELGHVPPPALPLIAQALNLSRAEVHGVVSFYHHFRSTPPGRSIVRLCRAEACQSAGARALEAHARRTLGIDFHETTADGAITLEPAYCLGNCGCGPSLLIGADELHANVTPASFDALVDRCRRDASPAAAAALPSCLAHASGADRDGVSRVTRIYVPRDASALALGAETVAQAIAAEATRRGIAIELVRNGSRGMFWLEPLVEVQTHEAGRVAYGPVVAADVADLFDAGFLHGGAHALRLGVVEQLDWFRRQERLCFERVGVIDPLSVDDYLAHGGYRGLRKALAMTAADIVREVTDSGLRGRGGAAFPTGIKWKTVLDAPGDGAKYIVCNADEGDSGTFSDRMLIEGDPLCLVEGMTIAGLAVGATRGYIYLRCEYPHAHRAVLAAIANARAAGWLGDDIAGSGRGFHVEVRLGAGAYICGEETSMLESLEGRRGQVRAKPPLPALKGLFGRPTVINNVISFASVPRILDRGAAEYRDYGVGRSRGTLPIQLAGNLKRTGLVEKAFGLSLRELLYDWGGGSRSGRPIRAVQVGGPLGAYLPESQFDTVLDYEAFAALGAMLGHGGIVAFDDSVDMAEQARYAMAFCAVESCGKCTPCRIGSTRGVELIDRIRANVDRTDNLALLDDLCHTMRHGSLCALGGLTPDPVASALTHFPEDFARAPARSTEEESG